MSGAIPAPALSPALPQRAGQQRYDARKRVGISGARALKDGSKVAAAINAALKG